MRTKTLALSTLLGVLGTASVLAQSTNVYSINAVGYINVTLYPGYNLITCPLVCSPDNTLNTLLNNTNAQYQFGSGRNLHGAQVFQYINGVGYVAGDTALASSTPGGWQFGGTNTINPGQAIWFLNPTPLSGAGSSNMLATFVGTVPQTNNYNMTNTLYPGFNLVGSIIPVSGDLITNNISSFTNSLSGGATSGDTIYVYDPTQTTPGQQNGYSTTTPQESGGQYVVPRHASVGSWNGSGALNDPAISTVYAGFWYQSQTNTPNQWVENFTINP